MANVFPIKAGRFKLTTDGDLYIDENDVIRQNVSNFFNKPIVWNTGNSKKIYTELPAVEIESVYLNGIKLTKRIEYKVLVNPTGVEIIKEINNNSTIEINYRHFVIDPETGEQPVYTI